MEEYYQSSETGLWKHIEDGMESCGHLPVLMRWRIVCEMKLVWHAQALQVEALMYVADMPDMALPHMVAEGFITDKEFSDSGLDLDLWSDDSAVTSHPKTPWQEQAHRRGHSGLARARAEQVDSFKRMHVPCASQNPITASTAHPGTENRWTRRKYQKKVRRAAQRAITFASVDVAGSGSAPLTLKQRVRVLTPAHQQAWVAVGWPQGDFFPQQGFRTLVWEAPAMLGTGYAPARQHPMQLACQEHPHRRARREPARAQAKQGHYSKK